MSPNESEAFVDAGFSVQERLHLLALDLPHPGPATLPLAKAARRDRAAVLELDDLSFDDFWRLRPAGLKDTLDATPASRFHVARDRDRVLAYAITGVAGRFGYLQRIAVHPEARRQRLGQRLGR